MIENEDNNKFYVGFLAIGIIYPSYFELKKVGKTQVDLHTIGYIAFSCVNIYI